MMKVPISIFKSILSAGLSLLISISVVQAQSVHISSSNSQVSTLVDAIELAKSGDILTVNPGYYPVGTLEISKPLTIRGVRDESGSLPVIDGLNMGHIFIVRSDNVTISNLEIRNSGRSYIRDFAAILVERSVNVVIADNKIYDVFFGIYLAESNCGSITGNKVEAYDTREATSGNGIHLWNVKNPLVTSNTVTGMRDGIYLEFVENARIRDNTSSNNNRYGLHYMFSNGGSYENNIFRKNGAGVAVMYSDNVLMSGNTFEHNWGASAYGLLLKDIRDSKVTGNRFYRNTVAIYSEGSSNIDIDSNHIEMNGWAINIKSNSTRNVFSNNNFIENSLDVRTDSPRNNNTFYKNYWSHYEGYDLDGDGFGDVPYRPVSLFSVLIERQPESLILLRSMFIRLLDTAERIMPVLTPKTLYDEMPRMQRIQ